MNEKQDEGRSRRKRIGAASAALTVAGSGVLLLGISPVSPAHAAPADKWFVCKFVSTPGGFEVDQTGNNPIDPSVASILQSLPAGSTEADIHKGTEWTDAQGKSIVWGPDTTGNGGGQSGEPSLADCATLINPPPTTEPPGTTEPPASSAAAAPSSEAAAASSEAAAPVPGAVAAGQHSVSSTSIALGGLLMASGVAGLAVAARPRKRHAG
jgi:hypothetical protein